MFPNKKSKFTYNNKIFYFTISVGGVLYDGNDIEELIEKVGYALYQVKDNGRNQVAIFSS